jgi:hypothetical protein
MKYLILCTLIIFGIVTESKAQSVDYSVIGRNGIYAEYYSIRHDFWIITCKIGQGGITCTYQKSDNERSPFLHQTG